MKRIIALLICVTATLCLFSCKGDDNEKGGETEKTNEKNETVIDVKNAIIRVTEDERQ